MASSFNPQLETTFISEFVDSSGRIVHSQEFSFTSDASSIPSNVAIAKIMGEISRILSTAECEEDVASSSRNTLRFSLENPERPPRTVKFTTKLKGLLTGNAWDIVVGSIMDAVSQLVSDSSVQFPPESVKSPPSISQSHQKSFSSPSPQSSSMQRHLPTSTLNGTLKSPIPCKLPSLNELKRFIKSHPLSVLYVPLENRSELMPAVLVSYPANGDENMITCKLGLWRGATEITCRLSEIVMMKEIPQFAKMNAYSNPPASQQDFGIGEESRIAEFLGIVEIALPGKSCERLRIRYGPKSEDEVPLFRCTLFREGSIIDILKKRGGLDTKKPVQTGPQTEVRELKFSETIDEGERRGRASSRAAKRGISEAIEVAEDAETVMPERRKSLRLSHEVEQQPKREYSRRSAAPTVGAHSAEFDQVKCSGIEEMPIEEASDELPLKENTLLQLSMSPAGANSDSLQQVASNTVPRLQSNDKTRRNSMGNLQSSPANLPRSADKRAVKGTPNQLGQGRRGLRHSPKAEEGKEPSTISSSEMFRGEIFMVLNSGEKSPVPADDESQSVDAIERKLRQFGGQVVELLICNGNEGFSKMTVVCKQEMKSFKYLYALAAGIPCVSYDWVNACLDTGSLVDKFTFLLPAGKDEHGNILHQRAPYTHIFNSTKFYVAARCKEFYVTWQALLQVAGATVLPSINTAPNIRRHFSQDSGLDGESPVDVEATNKEAESLIPSCEFVLVEPDPECAPMPAVINVASAHNVPLVTCKWLIRCFLTGRFVNPSDDAKAFTWWGSIQQAAAAAQNC